MLIDEIKSFLSLNFKKKFTIIKTLTGGMMNQSFVLKDENDSFYVLYIPTKEANEMVDRENEKDVFLYASSLGISNKSFFFDTKKGIKINSYIAGDSLNHIQSFDYGKIASLLKKFHSGVFRSKYDYQPFKRLLEEYEKNALNFQKEIPDDYKQLRSVLINNQTYLESQEKTICHNDFQRSNIIKSDNDEYYVIDFEFAANNDPIYDIAAFGNNSVLEGRILLDYYKNFKTNNDDIKRFYLWRIFLSLQWYNVAISKHYNGEGKIHNFNFLDVATFFLNNAKEAYEFMNKEIKQ